MARVKSRRKTSLEPAFSERGRAEERAGDGAEAQEGTRKIAYRMPAEWEPHEATWLAWPHERTDWPGKFAPIPWVYADIVRHLARVERVRILVQDRGEERAARRILQKSGADLARWSFSSRPPIAGGPAISGRYL